MRTTPERSSGPGPGACGVATRRPLGRGWVDAVEHLVASGASLHRSKHADTYRWARPGGHVYVKVYRRYRRWTAIKDWFRPSKAVHVQRVSAALAAEGFLVPDVLAAGEERRGFVVRRSFVATAGLGGEPIAARVAALAAAGDATTLGPNAGSSRRSDGKSRVSTLPASSPATSCPQTSGSRSPPPTSSRVSRSRSHPARARARALVRGPPEPRAVEPHRPSRRQHRRSAASIARTPPPPDGRAPRRGAPAVDRRARP